MKLLFVKDSLCWPRSSGHDVHTYYMMKECASLGHQVALATVAATGEKPVEGVSLDRRFQLDDVTSSNGVGLKTTWLQKRFRSFWGVADRQVAALASIVGDYRPDAVIVVGLDALPYFPALEGVTRIWYAADEWIWHHLSQLKIGDSELRANLYGAGVKGLYERAHSRAVDRVWVVSDGERRAMRWLAGMRQVDVVPNGVDSDFFCPGNDIEQPRTAVFWGRLDFGPNIQALEWFCGNVWPTVRRMVPDARFTIVGFNPSEPVRRLAAADGVSIVADVPDLRSLVRQHALVVLPFVSGGGIKNKLLEAASMARPILCTPRACNGLRHLSGTELVSARRPEDWSRQMLSLWEDESRRDALGKAARRWVMANHDWRTIAREAVDALRC